MLIVTCQDGYAAFGRFLPRRIRRQYMSDVVRSHLEASGMVEGVDYLYEYRKGMMLGISARIIRRFIKKHNQVENNLLCIGKSMGGRDLIKRVLNKIGKNNWFDYNKKYVLTVDANWNRGFKAINRNDQEMWLGMHLHSCDRVANFYQTGKIGGIMLFAPTNRRLFGSVGGEPVDHFNIVNHRSVKHWLKDSIQELGK